MNSCIYMMFHEPSGKFYIGSTIDLHRRKSLWRRNMAKAKTSRAIAETSLAFADWRFVPLQAIPGNTLPASRRIIEQAERKVIVEARERWPDHILNSVPTTTRPGGEHQPHAASTSKTLAEHGMPRSSYYLRRSKGLDHSAALGAADGRRRVRGAIKIENQQGRLLTQAETARLLGCTVHSLKMRLRRYRKSNPRADRVYLGWLREGSRAAGRQLPGDGAR